VRGYDARWRDVRAAYLASHPLCVDCLKRGRPVAATEVHHIVRLSKGGDHGENNLIALCHGCHSRRTRRGE